MTAHDHRILCHILRNAIEVDKYDVTNSLSLELLCRRLVQIEARSPLNPDFSSLEMVMEDTVGAGGEAVTTACNSWLPTKPKEKAAVAKQTRLYIIGGIPQDLRQLHLRLQRTQVVAEDAATDVVGDVDAAPRIVE